MQRLGLKAENPRGVQPTKSRVLGMVQGVPQFLNSAGLLGLLGLRVLELNLQPISEALCETILNCRLQHYKLAGKSREGGGKESEARKGRLRLKGS